MSEILRSSPEALIAHLASQTISLLKGDFDKMQKSGILSEVLTVYMFYCATAKRQQTNQPWATSSFIQQGSDLSAYKIRRARKWLVENGFIEDVS